MNEFKSYHPFVNFTYFAFTIGFSCFFMHPICLGISLSCALSYLILLKGRAALKGILIYIIPIVILTSVINALFNHEGVTALSYLPGGNPFTMESVLYGFLASVMIACVICYFSCFNCVMTSDKFIYLFGKIIPAMSLVISMTLRFVPRFISQFKTVASARRAVGRGYSDGNILKRAKNLVSIFSIVITWSLENAIETSDSMKSRGYGLSGRTAFSVFTFGSRDKKAVFGICALGIYVFCGALWGAMRFECFPRIDVGEISFFSVSVFAAYFVMSAFPVIIELVEVRRWRASRSKM